MRSPGRFCVLVFTSSGHRRLVQTTIALVQDAALLFAAYAVVVTAMHLPFVMNTRIRAPLIEPALVILAGLALGAIARPLGMSPGLKTRWRSRKDH